MQAEKNSILGWLYRTIDLSGITTPYWQLPIQPSESYPWVLERIQCSYDSDNNDPSNFNTVLWALHFPQQDKSLMDLELGKPRPPISLTLNPGIQDLTAAATRPKEFYFKSPDINWPVLANQTFSFQVEDFAPLTGLLRILFIGSFIMPQAVIK